MENIYVNVVITDSPTVLQKIIILLRDFPEIRNSYDLIAEKYSAIYGQFECKRPSFDRKVRHIQTELGIFPASEEIRKFRKAASMRNIEYAKRNKTFLTSLKRLFKKLF